MRKRQRGKTFYCHVKHDCAVVIEIVIGSSSLAVYSGREMERDGKNMQERRIKEDKNMNYKINKKQVNRPRSIY
jgi:hypothetical protein